MKTSRSIFSLLIVACLIANSSCGLVHKLFAPKYGCPSDGRAVGAERILAGEKVPKGGKFRGGNGN